MNVAIIVAAGRGERAGVGRAKQFRDLAGAPVLVHTLRRFDECETVAQTVAVVPAEEIGQFEAAARAHGLRKLTRVVAGGATRTQSVRRGLDAVAANASIVAVHDGVRPLVRPAEIDSVVRAAEESGAAILVAPVVDTIKEVIEGVITQTFARPRLRRALTPQCFRRDLLERACESALALHADATDDSVLVERLGATVVAVEGDARNIKLTRAEDFALAEILLQGSEVRG
ncbi:MAG TPA: 2-C-methyl-D-erythritol 4-phosphate cytidylyltransferase [Pyrinomonadaceae bacterium]|jgi:2-C-methyl-D-erythritol 4-phosphate cytidylyltransferase|nr:2-C-methyl-D-erythritol 4-phosphate cytidylyltransferase [Pyrinomonadaceae bacterium]